MGEFTITRYMGGNIVTEANIKSIVVENETLLDIVRKVSNRINGNCVFLESCDNGHS